MGKGGKGDKEAGGDVEECEGESSYQLTFTMDKQLHPLSLSPKIN